MQRSTQSGYTLLVVMLGLLSMGGLVAAKFVDGARGEVERERRLHNERVLAEAKQALLMYAYNYPEIAANPRGPGRLPCPDTDGPPDGIPNTANDCEAGGEGMIGRLPWNAAGLDFYDARDADGQRLWYAVSANHNHFDNEVVNSADVGSITLHNQAGQRLYDGSVEGVVAVIIAPGAPVERGGALQDRVANPDDPEHYLDLFGAFDNAHFVNFDANNGFVVGPIEDMVNGTLPVNDQMVYITTAEIREVAEKATLRAYRDALTAYDARIDADLGNDDHYPWLYDYDVFEAGSGLGDEIDAFPGEAPFATEIANHLQNWGRVPSMFGRYFVDTDSERIESEFGLEVVLEDPSVPPGRRVGFVPDYSDKCPESDLGLANCGPADTVNLDFDGTIDASLLSFNFNSAGPLTNMRFSSTGLVNPYDSSLRSDAPGTIDWDRTIYLWDERAGEDGWTLCRDGVGDGDNDDGTSFIDCEEERSFWGTDIQVLRVMISMPFLAAGNPMQINLDYDNVGNVDVVSAADNNGHARIRAQFPIDASSLPLTIRYEYDDKFNDFGSWDVDQEGVLDLDDLAPILRLTMRYYPELPPWTKNDDWYQNVLFAYAPDYRPDAAADCAIGTDCLRLNNTGGAKNDKISVLVFGGPDAWNDAANDDLSNDLGTIFDPENFDSFAGEALDADIVFDAFSPGGNDRAIAVCERTAGGSRCF